MAQSYVAARVPADIKRKLLKHGVKTSEVIRRALEAEVRKREAQTLEDAHGRAIRMVKRKFSRDEIVRTVRGIRKER